MRKIRLFKVTTALICLMLSVSVFAQVDPSVSVIEVGDDGAGNIGVLETIINGDTDVDGKRLNPNRIYQLKAGAMYFMTSGITFGSANDTLATINIVGEEGDKKPMIFRDPTEGSFALMDVYGNINVKNVYISALNFTNGEGGTVFNMRTRNVRIELDGIITENSQKGAIIVARGVKGLCSFIIKNCYFRDNSQLGNSWNHSVFERGDNGEQIDTLWVENTTVTNAGMPFFGKNNPVNFMFFNHNTIINTTKYPIWMERFKEAYITNNMFINCNYEGECQSTWETQLVGDGIRSGILNIDTVEADMWFDGNAPLQEDVKYFASNNLSFYSPYLDKYYSGGYNDVADYPISNRTWSPNVGDGDIPIQVYAPVSMFNERALGLANDWPQIIFDENIDNTTDPMLKTKSIRDQAAGDEFAKFIRANYGVGTETDWDKTKMWFGDGDPQTIPGLANGVPSEDSEFTGMKDVTELPEDFSYSADLSSKIDMNHLGALSWFPSELAAYDGDAALAQVKSYYNNLLTPQNAATTVWDPAGNPETTGLWSEAANWTDKVAPNANKVVFNIPDAQVSVLNVASSIKKIVMGEGANGGTLKVTQGGTLTTTETWSGIGWTGEATLIVEEGGTVNFASHMWVGWEPGSKGIVEINGGTINVGEMFGMNFEGKGGIGEVHVNSGFLNLKQLHPSNSIRDGSVLDIKEGTVTIVGDLVSTVNGYIAAGKITAYGGAGTLSVVVADGITTITSATTPTNDIDTDYSSKVYPNPTNGILYIQNPSSGSFGYEIIAITGKVVSSKFGLTGAVVKADMSDLTNGIYIVNVISAERSVKHKVIFK